ncbi:hypothetical protein ASE75_09310 [Sphingomonas sp. Leaf17]|uniref:hypothetical protein n=1 Tax=Sphingomonas sp. Leaf17 TaxID=1735683 RepID=UPI0006F973B4|nr:hypothetical protein [Sphingomonas sp. Leaf17]KQM64190.1 hypothetical protein ASE75_09310 [Sphingomonas sp. Leaf17]
MLTLAACGGGDGVSISGVTIIPGATPTPTPTPSATATPISYAPAYHFGRDQSVTGLGVRVVDTITGSGAGEVHSPVVVLQPIESAIGFDYTAATTTYRARYDSDTLTVATTTLQSSRGAVTSIFDSYSDARTIFTRSNVNGTSGLDGGLDYVGRMQWDTKPADATTNGRQSVQRRVVFGTRTASGNVPSTGVAAFTGDAAVIAATPSGLALDSRVSAVALAASWPLGTLAGPVTLTLRAAGSTDDQVTTIRVTATFDRTSGTIRGNAVQVDANGGAPITNGYTGDVIGQLYGPAAVNGGLAIRLVNATGTVLGATVTIRR